LLYYIITGENLDDKNSLVPFKVTFTTANEWIINIINFEL